MTGHMQSEPQWEGGRKWSKGGEWSKKCVFVCVYIYHVCTLRRTQSYHLLAFGRLICICTVHQLCVCVCLRAREGLLLSARHVREGRRLAPHGTVCYHSASLIPSPHVCNLTWWLRAGGRERNKKKIEEIQMLPRKQALVFFLFFGWFDFFLWFFFLHVNNLVFHVTVLISVPKVLLLQYIVLPLHCKLCQECHCNLSVSGFQEIHFSCFIESFCFQRYYVLRASEVLVKLSLGYFSGLCLSAWHLQ